MATENRSLKGGLDYTQSLIVRFGDMMGAGFTVLPNILLKYQAELTISANELNFIAQVWYHWWSDKDAFPSMPTISKRMGAKDHKAARRCSKSLQDKGYLVVRDRVSNARGQLSSEYDFSPLIEILNRLYAQEEAERLAQQVGDWVVVERQNTPLPKFGQGGLSIFGQGPLPEVGTEEYKENKTQLEEDKNKDSNSFELLTQNRKNGRTLRNSKKRDKNDQTVSQQVAEPQPQRRAAGGMKPIGELLELHRPADAAANGAQQPLQPRRRGRPPKYPATPAIEAMIEQWTGELHDSPEHVRSNISQAARLWHESGVSEDTFRSLLYEARQRTKQAGNVEKMADGAEGELGIRNRMPYFFACLKTVLREDLQRSVNDRAPSNGQGKSSSTKGNRTLRVSSGTN